MKKTARFIYPYADKNFSFQAVGISDIDRNSIISETYNNEVIKKAKPFIQGDSNGWIMVEFWTKNESFARNAAKILSKLVDANLKYGGFKKEEII